MSEYDDLIEGIEGPVGESVVGAVDRKLKEADDQRELEELPPDPPGFDPSRAPRGGVSTGAYFTGELPVDILAVWVTGKRKQDEQTARTLIGAWGLEAFRKSEPHKQALLAAGRDTRMEPIRAAFIKALQKKQEKT